MSATAPDIEKLRRRALVASTVGTIIEWYDFGLYGLAASLVFPTLFFPRFDPVAGVLSAFAVFAVGYIARPLGGLLFGHFGDRIGRKGALVATVLLMGMGTGFVALVPTYGTVGIWGAVMLCVLRLLQGVGVGGEWSGSVLVAMEWAKGEKQGVAASWPQIGVPAGNVFANLAITGASFLAGVVAGPGPVSNEAFMTWGWRIPFALGFVLVAIGLWIRLGLEETPVFQHVVDTGAVVRQPILDAIKQTWPQIIAVVLLRASELVSFIIYSTFVYTFGVQVMHLSRNFLLVAVLIGLSVECVAVPIAGALADRFGRKTIFVIGVVLTGVMGFAYFAGFATGSAVIITAVIILAFIPHGLQYGAEGALVAEAFPDNLRYSGSSIGYQIASVFGAGLAPFIATLLLTADPHGYLVALYIAVASAVSLVGAWLIKGHRRATVGAEIAASTPK